MRPVVVKRLDRAHTGSVLVPPIHASRQRTYEIKLGAPARLPLWVIRVLRDARVVEYVDNGRNPMGRSCLRRTTKRVYSVRQVRA